MANKINLTVLNDPTDLLTNDRRKARLYDTIVEAFSKWDLTVSVEYDLDAERVRDESQSSESPLQEEKDRFD